MSDYTITLDLNGRIGKVIIPNEASKEELCMMKDFLCKAIDTRIENARKESIRANPLKADIGDIETSVRLYNVLKRSGCNTVEDVLSYSKEELKHFRNMGRKAHEECIEIFGEFGDFKADDEQLN